MKPPFTLSIFNKSGFKAVYFLCCFSVFNFAFAAPVLQAVQARRQLADREINLLLEKLKNPHNNDSLSDYLIDRGFLPEVSINQNNLGKIHDTAENNCLLSTIEVSAKDSAADYDDLIISKTKIISEPHTDVNEIPSNEKEGIIGFFDQLPYDNPIDNLFTVQVEKFTNDDETLWLSYEVFGVKGSSSISNSINSLPNKGGYLVAMDNDNEWETIEEPLNPSSVLNGENLIRFSVNPQADFGYKIRNVRIYGRKSVNKPVVFTESEIRYKKDGRTYVSGFVNNRIETVIINEQKILIDENKNFESYIQITDKDKRRGRIEVTTVDKNGIMTTEHLKISSSLQEANFDFDITPVSPSVKMDFGISGGEVRAYGARFSLPENALTENVVISVSELRKVEIAPLNPGMYNVTVSQSAYRFLPHGSKFLKEGKIALPYDSGLIPAGNSVEDIRTYYFEEKTGSWQELELDSIDTENRLIISRTSHFTDMINGVIQVPESPQTNAFAPTMMSDIKAADPTAGLNLMQPPSASQDGAAHISYPIVIPPGRNGMQPNLAIQYNSEGGNGWMGLGWDIATPMITIDTRWGVPKYDFDLETEIYLLNGEQLYFPIEYMEEQVPYFPNRHRLNNNIYDTSLTPRVGSSKQFYPRKESNFSKIERIGSKPYNYRWKVTLPDGTIQYYGGDEDSVNNNAVLRVGSNTSGTSPIALWKLMKVVDVFGNTIIYNYSIDNINNLSGVNQNLNGGKQIYLNNIKYTGKSGSNYFPYSIVFNRDTSFPKSDINISGNLGFKLVDGRRLNSIEIYFNNDEKIRSYQFTYQQGDFGKSLLKEIIEKDKSDEELYRHKFTYHSKNAKDYLGNSENHSDLVNEIPNNDFLLNNSNFSGKGTALGSSKTKSWSSGWYLGIGIGANPFSLQTTFGWSGDVGGSTSKAFVGQLDIDGDGLQDKVYRINGNMVYKKHTIQTVYGSTWNDVKYSHLFSDYLPIDNMGNIYLSKDETSNLKGVQIHFPMGMAGIQEVKSKSITNVFVTDANGDMLPDVVHNGVVYFNRIVNGKPTFEPTSSGSPNLIISAEPAVSLPDEVNDPIADEENFDLVKYWYQEQNNAYGNTVDEISGEISFDPENENSFATVSIETLSPITNKNCRYFLHTLTFDNPSVSVSIDLNDVSSFENIPLGCDFPIESGSNNWKNGLPIYFRIHSSGNKQNVVKWDPKLVGGWNTSSSTYDDENGLPPPNNSAYSDGFLLNENKEEFISGVSSISISWPDIDINSLSDDLKYEIFETVYPENENDSPVSTSLIGEIVIPSAISYVFKSSDFPFLSNITLNPTKLYSYKFKVSSDSNVDWKKIAWRPKLTYQLDGSNEETKKYPIPEYTVYKGYITEGRYIIRYNDHDQNNNWVPQSYSGKIFLNQNWSEFTTNHLTTEDNGEFYLIVKNQGKLKGKRFLKIENGIINTTVSELNDILVFEGEIDNPATEEERTITVEILPITIDSVASH